MRLRTRRETGCGSERGAALVEFALVLPLLLTLVLGIMDFGRAFNYWIDQTHMANTAARFAVTNRYPGCANQPSPCTPTLQNYIKTTADSADLRSGSTICVTFPNSNNTLVGNPVEVEAHYTFSFLPWFKNNKWFSSGAGLADVTIVGSATMRLEAEPTVYAAGCST